MAAAVDSNDVWRVQSSDLVPIGGETDGDYNVFIRELIPSPGAGSMYEVMELLGRGTFGQVLKCWKRDTNEVVAVKILKNVPSYTKQGQIEVNVLSRLRRHGAEAFNSVLCLESFVHRGHICIVFEMLHLNLYDYLKQGGFQPLPLKHIRPIAQQVLCCLVKLKELGLVHADLKPENIMLVDHGRQPFRVKVIDFGSASNRTHTNTTTYIQSRYYRAPEVIMGLPYTESIDMWSLACVLTELFLGWPLFPGSSEYDQISYICQMLGSPPLQLFNNANKSSRFFNKQFGQWALKPQRQFSMETGIKPKETRKFVFTSVSAIAQAGSHSNNQLTEENVIEQFDRVQFVSLLESLLIFNPLERAHPENCLQHPFITMHHLSMYTNCVCVQELIQCMRVCCRSSNSHTVTPSHPLAYTPPPLTYHVSALPNPPLSMVQVPPSWPLVTDSYHSVINQDLRSDYHQQLVNKLSVSQPHPSYTHTPYELYRKLLEPRLIKRPLLEQRDKVVNGRQAAALALNNVKTVTCKLCDWNGCTSDTGYAKHMRSKHSKEDAYMMIYPPEYTKTNQVMDSFAVGDKVILLQDMVRVALGEIAERTDCVHGNPLLEGEERVCVTQLTNGELNEAMQSACIFL